MSNPRRLITNKQWQQIWDLIAHYQFSLYFEHVDRPQWNREHAAELWGPFKPESVFGYGISAPGVEGPFFFREILNIKIPVPPYPKIKKFISELRMLTVQPMTVSDKLVEIQGYELENKAE